MKTKILFLLSAFISSALQAGVAPYEDCRVVLTNGAPHLERLPRNLTFTWFLDQFSIEPRSAESFIVSGRVIDNNAGAPGEGLAISIHPPGQPARLAAISDVDGKFRFRVWIEVPTTNAPKLVALTNTTSLVPSWMTFASRPASVNLPSTNGGDLCIGGVFDTNRLLVAGIVSKYSLDELKSAAKAKANPK